MFEQLSYLRQHRPLLGVFEQVPNFARLERGRLMQAFVEQLGAAGYVAHHQVMEARHFDACQHREREDRSAVTRDRAPDASQLPTRECCSAVHEPNSLGNRGTGRRLLCCQLVRRDVPGMHSTDAVVSR